MSSMTTRRNVLVTGANGYIGGAVARAFRRAGWRTYGLVRRPEAVADLARNEIHPIIGTPEDTTFLDHVGDVAFDVVVSNTEDFANYRSHLAKVGDMFEEIGRRSMRAGGRPLMMFSSGCKDYGVMAENDGDPGLAPHVETSPITPPEFLIPRASFGQSLLERHSDLYDATVLRPTNVYGYASSYYGRLFEHAAASASTFLIYGSPRAIMDALHVDDCADAYVALAEHQRGGVAGEAFNISSVRYDTAGEISAAVARSYGLTPQFQPVPPDLPRFSVHGLANFSQWVSSDKLRALTGWRDRRPAFPAGIDEYRLAYEAAASPHPITPL
ncbi:NAD-dependent epimerase/dehydratase family protein [Sphingomonas sp. PAMC 26605]|uniref:NAD-dependent epimerase/dehydratase family protein n=1 Tax=Sphingomonas sp. PAMC 26605 TaxID=1112214 RepID=UPI00026CB11A|nr:NAD(P)-dependent oxidoreductase [Sphingomonas sp. PAMC 26605]